MTEIFNLIWQASLHASVVGIVIVLFKALMKNRLNPKWHYYIWILLLVKLLIPYGPASSISIFNVMPKITEQVISQQLISDSSSQLGRIAEGVVLPLTATTEINRIEPIVSGQPEQVVLPAPASMQELLSHIWLVGVLLLFTWFVGTSYMFKQRLRKNSYPVTDQRICQIFNQCKIKLGIKADISLVMQNTIGTPALFGIVHPKILLSSTIESLRDKELEYIFLHELAHFKRKDLIVNHILLAVKLVHWFNPVLWYCSKVIRQDMELATDEMVLEHLENKEHKDYGRAILRVLEGLSTASFAPKVIGLVDDKKGIEKRLRMIKMAEIFKNKGKLMFVIGLVCLVALGGLLLTSSLANQQTTEPNQVIIGPYNANNLYENRTPYVGNNSKVANLISNLPFNELSKGIELQTKDQPYGLTVTYDFSFINVEPTALKDQLKSSSKILFSLIENVGIVNFKIISQETTIHSFTREDAQQEFLHDLREYAQNIESFTILLEELVADHSSDSSYIDLNGAITKAIAEHNSRYGRGEAATQAYIILDKEEKDGVVKVYAVVSYGNFGFENGIFTKVSGSGAIPTVLSFTRMDNGGYRLKGYQEPMDGSEYADSLRKMFPQKLHNQLFSQTNNYSVELSRQQEEQAAAYLEKIGREAQVQIGWVEKTLPSIDVQASNRLFSELTKYDSFLIKFPYWLGTTEEVDNGTRYIYETLQDITNDGYDIIVFRKMKENKEIIEERSYKIVGSEPQLIQ